VGKINLPVFSRYRVLELVSQEGWGWFETTLRSNLGIGGAGGLDKEGLCKGKTQYMA
jgi:hypothetical protein